MYYGYRCSSRGSVEVSDPRLGLMKREWFQGKDCLDLGCNTGQVRVGSLSVVCKMEHLSKDIPEMRTLLEYKTCFFVQFDT